MPDAALQIAQPNRGVDVRGADVTTARGASSRTLTSRYRHGRSPEWSSCSVTIVS